MTPAKKSGVPVIVWVLGGCGCLGAGVVVLGVLAALILPSFLSQATKARESEAIVNLRTIIQTQQAYQLDKQTFAASIDDLDISLTRRFFDYQLLPSETRDRMVVTATPLEATGLSSYTGFVFLVGDTPIDATSTSGICETDAPSQTPPAVPSVPSSLTDTIECPPGSSQVD